jgi:hypothetical protein
MDNFQREEYHFEPSLARPGEQNEYMQDDQVDQI